MITPNKVVSLESSALGLVVIVLEQGPNQVGIMTLYDDVSKHFENIDQFMLTIDLLYLLGRIDLDLETGVLSYVS